MIKKNSEKESDTKEKEKTVSQDNIVDVDLSAIQKKSFRLDGDNNRIVRLNTSDLNIASRFEEVYPRLINLTNEASDKLEAIKEEDSDKASETIKLLSEIDAKMRELVDYVFDEPVSDKAVPNGSMYDPFNGKFAFEYVFDKLGSLYGENFARERRLMEKRTSKHTSKYIG